ncbi:MAG: hypothetical protein P4K94_11600 [Terracidiphilus sp.]|jgi:hypothetical protein|nr:hypothetical protein [Terracidiphilus sp.]
MKLAIRISAFCIVLAGAAAVSFSSATSHPIVSHQSATASMPIPLCGPGISCGPKQ